MIPVATHYSDTKNMFSENYKPSEKYFVFNPNGDFVKLPDGKCVWMLDSENSGFPPC